MTALIDTNVLLDVLQAREGLVQGSAGALSLLRVQGHASVVSAITFNNAYYVLRRHGDRPRALNAIRGIRAAFGVVAVDAHLIDGAVASAIVDFEDANQFRAAVRAAADLIITRNTADFPPAPTVPRAVTPEQFLAEHFTAGGNAPR